MYKSFIAYSVFFACMLFTHLQSYEESLYADTLLANYYSLSNNAHAESRYEKILESHGTDEVFQSYILHLDRAQKYKKILACAEKHPALFSAGCVSYEQLGPILAHALELDGQQKEADTLYQKLSDAFPENNLIVYSVLQGALKAAQYTQVLESIDTLFKRNNQAKCNYAFHFLRYQAHAQLRQYVQAKLSLERAISLQPKFKEGWLLMALFDEQMGNVAKAQKSYEQVLDLSDQLLVKKLLHLDSDKKNTSDKRNLLKLDAYMAKEQFQSALQLICAQIEKNTGELWLKIGHLFYIKVPRESIRREFRNFLLRYALNTNELAPLLYVLDILLRLPAAQLFEVQKKYSLEAVASKAMALTNDQLLQSKILFKLGTHYYMAKNFKKIPALLSHPSLEITTFVPLLTFAAYYYAIEGNNTLAQKYINKVVGLGKIHEARSALEKAIAHEKNVNKKKSLRNVLDCLKN